MKTAISQMQVDSNLLARIRQKEKSLKEGRAMSCGQSLQREEDKFMPVDTMKRLQIWHDEPKLDDGFIEMEWPELSREKASHKQAESRAKKDHIIEKQFDRKAFNTKLQQDRLLQASRSAKRARYADEKPVHARTNSGSVGRGFQHQRDTASSSSPQAVLHEFKTALERTEQNAILRLLSRGDTLARRGEGVRAASRTSESG